jgi:hypothetical protein
MKKNAVFLGMLAMLLAMLLALGLVVSSCDDGTANPPVKEGGSITVVNNSSKSYYFTVHSSSGQRIAPTYVSLSPGGDSYIWTVKSDGTYYACSWADDWGGDSDYKLVKKSQSVSISNGDKKTISF